MNVIGVDLGGTNIEVGKLSKEKIESVLSVDTNSTSSKEEVLLQITSLIDKLIDKDTSGIGVAVPAIVDVENGIVFETVNIPSWKRVHLKEILEEKYKLPVFINNDANCFALGEKYFGVGKKYQNLVAFVLGTGLGGGIIVKGKLYAGYNGGAGEFGQILFKDNDFEYYCSGKYFLREHNISGKDLYEKARQHNRKALSIFKKFGENLGKALAMVVNSIDPEIIVLGGSVVDSYKYFEKSMKESLKKSTYERSFSRLKIQVSKMDHSVILGAGSLYWDSLK